MTEFDNFDDRDWRETLAELRLLVAGAGFSDWDSQAAAALHDSLDGRPDPKVQVLWYVRSFGSFLKVRSARNLERLREDLGEILRDEDGRPVTGAVVVDAYGDRTDEVLEGQTSDGLLEVLTAFANAVAGESGYFDGEDVER